MSTEPEDLFTIPQACFLWKSRDLQQPRLPPVNHRKSPMQLLKTLSILLRIHQFSHQMKRKVSRKVAFRKKPKSLWVMELWRNRTSLWFASLCCQYEVLTRPGSSNLTNDSEIWKRTSLAVMEAKAVLWRKLDWTAWVKILLQAGSEKKVCQFIEVLENSNPLLACFWTVNFFIGSLS